MGGENHLMSAPYWPHFPTCALDVSASARMPWIDRKRRLCSLLCLCPSLFPPSHLPGRCLVLNEYCYFLLDSGRACVHMGAVVSLVYNSWGHGGSNANVFEGEYFPA